MFLSTFQPSRDPNTGWRCHSTGAGAEVRGRTSRWCAINASENGDGDHFADIETLQNAQAKLAFAAENRKKTGQPFFMGVSYNHGRIAAQRGFHPSRNPSTEYHRRLKWHRRRKLTHGSTRVSGRKKPPLGGVLSGNVVESPT